MSNNADLGPETVSVIGVRRVAFCTTGLRNQASVVTLGLHPADDGFFDRVLKSANAVGFRYDPGKVRHFRGMHAVCVPNSDGIFGHSASFHLV